MSIPIIEIECSVEFLEETPIGPDVVRPVILIPVEGYNWISDQIAYYKSSGMSNAATDTLFKTRVRKFMWFPTIGILSDKKTLISTLMAMTETDTHHSPGYILKYPNIIFSKYGYKRSYQFFVNSFLRPPFTSVAPEYGMVSPYLIFLNFGGVLDKIQNKKRFTNEETSSANKLINQFNDFLTVMCQYCYNWKQIQDSIRLSVGNTIDGLSLMQTELGPICSFILQYDLRNEFHRDKVEIVLREGPQLPFFKVNYRPEKILVRTREFDTINNDYLLYNGAINFALVMEDYQGDNPENDFRPYYETMYLGFSFPKELSKGGRQRKCRHRRTRTKRLKTKRRKQKINRKKTKRHFSGL